MTAEPPVSSLSVMYGPLMQACLGLLGYSVDGLPDAGLHPPFEPATLREMYQDYLDTRLCVEEGGFAPDPVLSEADFVAQNGASPYAGVDLAAVNVERLFLLCRS